MDIKKKVAEWVKGMRSEHGSEAGYRKAFKRLIMVGVSPSMAQKLLAGTYPNEPKRIITEKCEKAMAAE